MMQDLSLKQKKILIIIGIVITIGIMYYIYNKTGTSDELNENILIKSTDESKKDEEKEEIENKEWIIVHVTGAVKTPRNS